VTIKDVFLVDGLKHNLLSISQLCYKGYKITFELDLCLIENSTTGETVLVGKGVNNMCMLNMCSIDSSLNYILSKNGETLVVAQTFSSYTHASFE